MSGLSWHKMWTIMGKEWAEVFKNRLVLFTVFFLPLLMAALPLITLGATGSFGLEEIGAAEPLPPQMVGDWCEGLSELACTQVYTLNLFTLMLMVLPVAIPVTIAAYSVVGEKNSRSLEPLLATPITTTELVLAKVIAAIAPAVAATWLAYGIYMVGAWFMVETAVFQQLLDPTWLLAIFVVSPLLTALSANAALSISSRVSDPRVAEQLSALVVLPIILLVVGQSTGLLLVNRRLIFIIGLVVLLLDTAVFFLSIKIFERETILTRWK